MNWMTLIAMLFLHIFNDFYLQGCLAQMKQKAWWQENGYFIRKYQFDYLCALFAHAFSWTACILTPIVYYNGWVVSDLVLYFFIGNTIIHAFVDNLKANWHSINLWQDQILHLLQIIITWVVLAS